jgi:hypothetical protein
MFFADVQQRGSNCTVAIPVANPFTNRAAINQLASLA